MSKKGNKMLEGQSFFQLTKKEISTKNATPKVIGIHSIEEFEINLAGMPQKENNKGDYSELNFELWLNQATEDKKSIIETIKQKLKDIHDTPAFHAITNAYILLELIRNTDDAVKDLNDKLSNKSENVIPKIKISCKITPRSIEISIKSNGIEFPSEMCSNNKISYAKVLENLNTNESHKNKKPNKYHGGEFQGMKTILKVLEKFDGGDLLIRNYTHSKGTGRPVQSGEVIIKTPNITCSAENFNNIKHSTYERMFQEPAPVSKDSDFRLTPLTSNFKFSRKMKRKKRNNVDSTEHTQQKIPALNKI